MPYLRATKQERPDGQLETGAGAASDDEAASGPGAGNDPTSKAEATRQTRRLPERILVAAHQACDQGALDVASSLLSIMEVVLQQPQTLSLTAHRRTIEGLVAGYERLWHLKHADQSDPSPLNSA